MASDDRNEEFDNVVITESIEDPTGTTHTELNTGSGGGGSVDSSVVTGPATLVEAADSPYSASAGEIIGVNSGGGNVTIVLPSSPSGAEAVEVFVINDSNTTTVDAGSNNIEPDAATITNNDVRLFRYYGGWWRAHGGDRNDFSGRAIVDPSGKTIGTTDSIATEDQLGGGGGSTDGPFSTTLMGSNNISNPDTGLHTQIQNALNESPPKSIIHIRGAWQAGGDTTFDASSDTHGGGGQRLPLVLDARGALIEYTNGGTMFLNDMTGNIDGASNGGRFIVEGGSWLATNGGTFIEGHDQTFGVFNPDNTHDFDVVYKPLIGTRWCESNYFSGVHIGANTVLEDGMVGGGLANGESYQDNYCEDMQLGQISNYGFDLSGNWHDCLFDNMTFIAGSAGSALLHFNGNMDGSTFQSPEIENAPGANNSFEYYIVEVGPSATTRAPNFWDMKNDYMRSLNPGLVRVKGDTATSEFNIWMTEQEKKYHDRLMIRGNGDMEDDNPFLTCTRFRYSEVGLERQTTDTPENDSSWQTQASL